MLNFFDSYDFAVEKNLIQSCEKVTKEDDSKPFQMDEGSERQNKLEDQIQQLEEEKKELEEKIKKMEEENHGSERKEESEGSGE